MVIPDFFTILQTDFQFVKAKIENRYREISGQNSRIKLVGIRIISAVGMAWGGMQTFSAFFRASTLFTSSEEILWAIGGVIIYLVCHDLFMMSKNEEDKYSLEIQKHVSTRQTGSYLTRGAFFSLLWDELLRSAE